ncbi:MAG: hypothetical protein R3337_03760 [Gammaproteobacteria bacterium]|nr:hypothetical protein [Gammaproteobacteria bacterium]
MSTVLWANCLVDGAVTSDQSDKYALFKHTDKLDVLCRDSGITPLSEVCDSTDMRFNVEDLELPDGMESTDELMARDGVWIDAQSAVTLLETLLGAVRSKKPRFGLLKDNIDDVVSELEESIAFAKAAAAEGAKFNFSIVM